MKASWPALPDLEALTEASTWAMIMLGVAGIGFAGYRASRKGDAVTA